MMKMKSNTGPELEITGLSKQFPVKGDKVRVLENLNFSAMAGEFVCILGPSGCGKSTLLKLLAGFIRPSSGSIQDSLRIPSGVPSRSTEDRARASPTDLDRLCPSCLRRGCG